jgi:hypothetical protein
MAIFQALTEKSNSNTNPVVDHSLVAVRTYIETISWTVIFAEVNPFVLKIHRHTQRTVFATDTEMGWRTYSDSVCMVLQMDQLITAYASN